MSEVKISSLPVANTLSVTDRVVVLVNPNTTPSVRTITVGNIVGRLAANMIPAAGNTYSLGNSTNAWQSLYVSSNTIFIGNTPLSVANGQLFVNSSPVSGGGSANTGNISFDNETIFAPNGSIISVQVNDSEGNSAAQLTLSGEYSIARLRSFGSGDATFYSGEFGDFSSGTWEPYQAFGQNRSRLIFTNAINLYNFVNDDPELSRSGDAESAEWSIDGENWYPYPYGYSWNDNTETIIFDFTNEEIVSPPEGTVTVENFQLRWINESKVSVDHNDYQEVQILGAGIDVKIESTESINIEAGDGLNLESAGGLNLQTSGASSSITISTNIYGSNKNWTFGADGVLQLANGSIISESVIDSQPTLELRPSSTQTSSAGQRLIIKGGQGGDPEDYHLHLVTGDSDSVSLFLGSDYQHFKVSSEGGLDIRPRLLSSVNIFTTIDEEDPNQNQLQIDPTGMLQFNGIPFKVVPVPLTSVGADGDQEGMVALSNSHIYYCLGGYDGQVNIWKRIAWSNDTW